VIYLSERDPQHHAWAYQGVGGAGMRLKILLSYHYYKTSDLDTLFERYFKGEYPEVFADSGGFSAATQGAVINLREYAEWIKRWAHLFTTYANLDVIGDPVATLANQSRLEDLGLHPLPVFHTGEDWKYLDRYIERYPYIALGGMVPYMRFPAKIMPWTIQAFKRAQGRAVFHGFGATAWKIVRDLPWYSVDSSSWGQGFRFGQVPLFNEQRGGFIKVNLGDPKTVYRHAALIRKEGFDPADFADRNRNQRAKICAISAVSYMRAEAWLRQRHGEIHIPGREGGSAVLRSHLADANPQRFGDVMSGATGVRLHLSDTSNGVNLSDADAGIKLHLADARGSSVDEIVHAGTGLRLHLAEHSLDRGGVGDTSRAMEILNG
jgi:hypothetical protein